MLPSGLPDVVADSEDLARFLTSSSQYSVQRNIAKPSAFLPAKDRETSVFRHGAEPREPLWEIGGGLVAGGRTIHGAAIVRAGHVRAADLNVLAAEPPPRHAAIRGWPWLDDPDEQKAQQKKRAILVANKAILLLR